MLSRQLGTLVVVVALLGVSATPAVAATAAPSQRAQVVDDSKAGHQRVLVTYREGAAGRGAIERRLARQAHRVARRYQLAPTMLVDTNARQIERLARDPAVTSIVADTPAPVADAESTPLVGATATHAADIDGTGAVVAVLDTGVDGNHPLLAGKVVAEACFAASGSCPNGLPVQVGAGSAVPCSYAARGCRHGTHVAGIAAGRRTPALPFDGVAPGADIIAVQVFTKFEGDLCFALGQGESPCTLSLPSDRISGLEFVAFMTGYFNVAAANMSIGGGLFDTPCDFAPETPIIELLRKRNVATTISAGNDGSSTHVSAPGCISSAVTVGATNKLDGFASFTNSNPIVDIVAPGVSINSSVPGGGTAFFNGTSMAAPHVMGAFALARQLTPNDPLDVVQARLVHSGPVLTDPRNGLSFHRLDVMAALHAVQIDPGFAVVEEGDDGGVIGSIPITLSRASSLSVSAQVQLLPITTDDDDLTATPGVATFDPGQTSSSFDVTIHGDRDVEGDELFLVVLHTPTNGAVGGFLGLGVLVITEDATG